MSVKCPYCGRGNIQTERRLDGFHHCIDCHYSWRIGSSTPVIPLQKNMEPFEQFSLLKYVDLVVGLNKTDLRKNILCDRCKIEALEELLKDLKARGKNDT